MSCTLETEKENSTLTVINFLWIDKGAAVKPVRFWVSCTPSTINPLDFLHASYQQVNIGHNILEIYIQLAHICVMGISIMLIEYVLH